MANPGFNSSSAIQFSWDQYVVEVLVRVKAKLSIQSINAYREIEIFEIVRTDGLASCPEGIDKPSLLANGIECELAEVAGRKKLKCGNQIGADGIHGATGLDGFREELANSVTV